MKEVIASRQQNQEWGRYSFPLHSQLLRGSSPFLQTILPRSDSHQNFLFPGFFIRMKFIVLSDQHNRIFFNLYKKLIIIKIATEVDSDEYLFISCGHLSSFCSFILCMWKPLCSHKCPPFSSYHTLVKSISVIFTFSTAKCNLNLS